ncbi:MAG: helix-turn-helix domain-containing protein [Bacillota bacterium]
MEQQRKKEMGQRIRRLRKAKKLSLAELAKKINKTSSYLSQIERGLAEPSLQALREISHSLETPIFYLLADEWEYNRVVRKDKRKKFSFPDSRAKAELISEAGKGQFEMVEVHLNPGQYDKSKPDGHPGEECILVLEGESKVIIGEEKKFLTEGDSIYFFGKVPHKVVNTGEKELVYLSTITPTEV